MIIRKIENREYFNFNYVNLNLYLKNKFKNKIFIIYIKRNVYVVDNFKIKMFIDINIICSKEITINLQIRQFIINNYNITTSIIYTLIDFKINRIVKFYYIVTILIYIVIIVSFK